MIIQRMTVTLNGVATLTHLGVIRADGADAASFLHGQLTQDFEGLDSAQARFAAYCTAKGRMLASFIGLLHADGGILLVCSRDLLAPTLKRLSMFVLRAKVTLSDATAQFALYGLAGEAACSQGVRDLLPWARREAGTASVVALPPSQGQTRALWVDSPPGHPAPAGDAMALGLWQWGEVMSGVATVSAPLAEALVPQMLNYESVGGVNFRKGCYPGQEIVARSQFRGTLKRRAFLAHAQATMHAGQEIFHSSDAEQPCGVVVQSAVAPGGGSDAIISIQIAASESGALHVGKPAGEAMTLQPLPYPLLDDV